MDFQDNNEVFSLKLSTKFRLFYFDLKKSAQGFFVKVSEKSAKAGRSTIMFDAEDIDNIIDTLTQIRSKIQAEGGKTNNPNAAGGRVNEGPSASAHPSSAPSSTPSSEPSMSNMTKDIDMDSDLA